MPNSNKEKYDKILDALQELLESKEIHSISVSEIAQKAGIGKGSVYYYFSSKDEILEALVERNYEKPIETAKNLAKQTGVSPFTRMAMIFQACRNSSSAISVKNPPPTLSDAKEQALLHQKYMHHLIQELKPELTKIIEQGIESGDIHFDHPSALAEIVLIVLSVKLDNTLVPSTPREIEETILGLISLLEKGTDNPKGSLNFLTAYP
ncbi:MAG: TetR/AcrR family transcriptional regulator [Ruminococcus sp.]